MRPLWSPAAVDSDLFYLVYFSLIVRTRRTCAFFFSASFSPACKHRHLVCDSIQRGRLKLSKVYCFRHLSPFQYSLLTTAESWQAAFELFVFTSYCPTGCNNALFNVFWCMCYLINLLSADHLCLAHQNLLQKMNSGNNIISCSEQSLVENCVAANAVSLAMLVYISIVHCWWATCIHQHW